MASKLHTCSLIGLMPRTTRRSNSDCERPARAAFLHMTTGPSWQWSPTSTTWRQPSTTGIMHSGSVACVLSSISTERNWTQSTTDNGLHLIIIIRSYVSRNALQAEVPQRASPRERRPSIVCSPLVMFFSGDGRDSWSLVRRSSQPHSRNRQKSHALHSWSGGNYVPVPTYIHSSSVFQRSVPCQNVHSFRVPFAFANFKSPWNKVPGQKNNNNNSICIAPYHVQHGDIFTCISLRFT